MRETQALPPIPSAGPSTFAVNLHEMRRLDAIAMIIALCLANSSWGQILPVDSITGRVTYTGVLHVDSTSAEELFNRATLWYASTFPSAKAAMELSDRQAGVIVSDPKVNFPAYFIMNNGTRRESGSVRFSLKIQCKEGRFKYTLTDLVHVHPQGYTIPFEVTSQLSYRQYLWTSLKNEANKSVVQLIQSLSKSMTSRTIVDGGDW